MKTKPIILFKVVCPSKSFSVSGQYLKVMYPIAFIIPKLWIYQGPIPNNLIPFWPVASITVLPIG